MAVPERPLETMKKALVSMLTIRFFTKWPPMGAVLTIP
jgi:hypothetical protein